MSFEITATIANFGGKLLKLAHQVNTYTMMVHTSGRKKLTNRTSSPKQPQPK